MSNLIIFYTSIFIEHLRTGCHHERIVGINGLIRNSSVVLAELWRGAAKPAEQIFLKELEKNHPVLTPSEKNWLESGQLLAKIRQDSGFTPDKLRNLYFDLLIALTARTVGARLVTANRGDFELIKSYRNFQLEVW